MVGACIMPCRAPVAQGAAVRGAGSRPGRAQVPGAGAGTAGGRRGAPRARTVAAEGRVAVVVLWRPDSDRRPCLSVLDST